MMISLSGDQMMMMMMIRYITGCIEVCDDVDGCNKVQKRVLNEYILSLLVMIGIFLC